MTAPENKSAKRGMLRVMSAESEQLDTARRKILADWCRLLGKRLNGDDAGRGAPLLDGIELTPRLRQTLSCLLGGDSEKQIALKLHLSPHTIHSYVKDLHRRFNVASRGELLAKFVNAELGA